MSWAKTYWHHQSSPSMTMSSKLFINSHTLGPPSLITSPLILRLTRGLERQPQHSLTWHQECGQTPSWLWRQRWLCTMPASSANCSMAARHGPHMPIGRKGSTLSISEAYDAYLASCGKTSWPPLTSCLELASPPCTPCWDKVGCTGLAMSAIWRMAKFQKMSSMESLPQGREAPAGEACFTNSCRLVKRSRQQWQQRSEPTKRKWQPTDQRQHTDATYVIEIATLTLVSTATGGTAQAEQTARTSNGWIIIIHGQPWPTEAYYNWLQKPQFQLYGWWVVSACCSARDTDFKNLSPNFRCDGVSTLAKNIFCISVEVPTSWSACDTDFKNISSNLLNGGLSLPFDQQMTLTSKT